jgi:CheY-like chemotaxis protein
VGEKRKLLVIDDSELSLQVIVSVLTHSGYDVRASTTVANLATALGEWKPDLILTDVDMPGITGVELCRRLKSTYDTAHVPVVLFSAREREELEQLAAECDADGFLCKCELDELPDELALVIDQLSF